MTSRLTSVSYPRERLPKPDGFVRTTENPPISGDDRTNHGHGS
ncbi:hypothetical protein [Amycolatopsis sacchari]|nr:hypothetical protein [Amycolatopsis sacchari]